MSVTRYILPKLRAKLLAGEPLPNYWAKNPRASYIRAIIISAPAWCDAAACRAVAKEAKLKTLTTGIKHVTDHIVPVVHPLVCGLTVPWNLRAIDWIKNAKKSNKLHPAFQLEMFEQPEQLKLL